MNLLGTWSFLPAIAIAALATSSRAQLRVTERAMWTGVESIASGGYHDSVRNLLVLSSLGELKEWDGPGTARSPQLPLPVQAAVCELGSEPGSGLVWNPDIGTLRYRGGEWTQLLAPGTPLVTGSAVTRQRMVWNPARQRALLLVEPWLSPTLAFEFTGTAWEAIPTPPGTDVFGGLVFDAGRNMPLVLTDSGAFLWNGSSWQATVAPSGQYVVDRAMAWDAARSRLVAFGGWYFFGITVDTTLEWDGTQWLTRNPAVRPPARSGSTLVYDRLRRQCVLFGGDVSPTVTTDEVWGWDGTVWSNLSASTTRPPALNDAMLAEDESYGSVLFGGRDLNNQASAATWLWDGDRWTDVSALGTAGARSAGAMARHSPSSVLLFGGIDSNGLEFGDTWTFTVNGGWQQRFPFGAPSARLNHAMASDAANGSTVWLFGGSTGANFHGDLWYFSTAFGIDQWVNIVVSPSPGARDIHAMACDERRRKLVVFGGRDVFGNTLDDTWEFDLVAQTWTQASPAVRPAARVNHALVFDSLRSRCVLIGGYSAAGAYLDDVWEWDGVHWQQAAPATRSIRGTENPAACHDRYTHRIVVFGGQNGFGGPLSDTTYELQGHVDRAALAQSHPIDLAVTGWPVVGALQAPLRVAIPAAGGISALFVGIDPAPEPYAIGGVPTFCSTQGLYVPGIVNFLAFGNPGVVSLQLPPIAAGARLTFQGVSLRPSGCVDVTDAWLARVRSF